MSQNLRSVSRCALIYVRGIAALCESCSHAFPLHHGILAEAMVEEFLKTEVGDQLDGTDVCHDRMAWSWRFHGDICEPIQLADKLAKQGLSGNAAVLLSLGATSNCLGAFFGYFLCTSKESDSRKARNVLRALARKLLSLSLILISPQTSTRTWQGRSA